MGFLALFSATMSIYLYGQSPSSHSRFCQITQQLRTDDVLCRESAGAGPVALKVVPVTRAAFTIISMDQSLFVSLFPHLLVVLVRCDSESNINIGGVKNGLSEGLPNYGFSEGPTKYI